MKAYVLENLGQFNIKEVPTPSLSEGRVLVKVHAAGICGSDIPRIFHTGAYHYPLIPGHEFSGEIVGVFDEDSDKDIIGKRVGVFPLIPCMKCPQCLTKKYEMCKDYSYLGSRTDGGFAEYVAVPKENLIFLPENVTYSAAAMLEPLAVAAHAVRRISPQKNETVAVCGLGTIGMLVTMLLIDLGIEDIMVIANKESQRLKAMELGIPRENIGLKNRPIDVFFECVGSNETINWALKYTAPGGRVMLVGNPKGDMNLERDIYWKILRNQLTLMGTWNSSFSMDGFQALTSPDDWKYALDRLENGRINPEKLITHRYTLEEFGNGFDIMKDKSEDYIKVMMDIDKIREIANMLSVD